MEDQSFKSRVDKVFGSLSSTRRSSSLWSIGDDHIDRKLWRRSANSSARDDAPSSSSFDDILKKKKKKKKKKFGDNDPEGSDNEEPAEWDIRSSIGLDPTLDFEEEEDEFDRVASGRENAGDRLYMREVTEEGSYLNSENVLGNKKDPRANHVAAKFRLKEDDGEAQNIDSDATGCKQDEEAQPRPVLKRKDNEAVSKSRKRVRFDVHEAENNPVGIAQGEDEAENPVGDG